MRLLAPLAAVAVIVAVTLTLTACSTTEKPKNDVYSVAIGDCFDLDGASAEVESVPVISCTTPHDFEAFAGEIMDAETYPGEADTIAEADARCGAAFEPYVGITLAEAYESSTYDYTYFYPSEQSWALGDREILCLVHATDTDGAIVKVSTSLQGVGSAG